ncbi:MAG: hypothetical protein AVDCRST_MAG42-525, partial [uncultured Chthoniobacterales bacterium]
CAARRTRCGKAMVARRSSWSSWSLRSSPTGMVA